MATLTNRIIDAGLTDHILTDVDLNNLLTGTPAVRYGLVNKALSKGELIKIRRGLYVIAEKYRKNKFSKSYLASRIVPHSYISLESALSYYGWIPERVVAVTSIVSSRTKKFLTPFGEFVFYHMSVNEFQFLNGVVRVEDIKGEPYLIATPLRALIDYIHTKKIDWQGMDYLLDGLRIELEQLKTISVDDIIQIKKIYHATRTNKFIEQLILELKK